MPPHLASPEFIWKILILQNINSPYKDWPRQGVVAYHNKREKISQFFRMNHLRHLNRSNISILSLKCKNYHFLFRVNRTILGWVKFKTFYFNKKMLCLTEMTPYWYSGSDILSLSLKWFFTSLLVNRGNTKNACLGTIIWWRICPYHFRGERISKIMDFFWMYLKTMCFSLILAPNVSSNLKQCAF